MNLESPWSRSDNGHVTGWIYTDWVGILKPWNDHIHTRRVWAGNPDAHVLSGYTRKLHVYTAKTAASQIDIRISVRTEVFANLRSLSWLTTIAYPTYLYATISAYIAANRAVPYQFMRVVMVELGYIYVR